MKLLDYGSSYVCFSGPENAVRFWIESRTRIVDENGERAEDYYQCGACKSEHTWTTKKTTRFLFSEDNHDFTPVFGPDYSVIFRRKAYLSDRYRKVVSLSSEFAVFGSPAVRVREAHGTHRLDTPAAVREATHAALPLVARVEIANQETNLKAVIECPIKTININAQRNLYQVDTGPVAWPDLATPSSRLADTISLAFVAFNSFSAVDFIVEAATPLVADGQETGRVHHYSDMLRLPATNSIYCVTGPAS